MSKRNTVEQAAERILELEAELENSGSAATEGNTLAFARAALHDWVDSVVGVVSSPGVGRVTLIHANGTETKISSPDLPYQLLPAVSFTK